MYLTGGSGTSPLIYSLLTVPEKRILCMCGFIKTVFAALCKLLEGTLARDFYETDFIFSIWDSCHVICDLHFRGEIGILNWTPHCHGLETAWLETGRGWMGLDGGCMGAGWRLDGGWMEAG